METKIDDAPRNAKELHAHEEFEEIVKSGKLEIKQLLDMEVFVLPSDEEVDEIRAKIKRVLRCKMVYARKYESVVCDDGQIRDRFLKWKGRLAAVGTGEVKSLDTCWSTFSPTIGMTAMRTLIALMCRKGFDVRSNDLSGAFLGTVLAREVYVKLPEDAGKYTGKVAILEVRHLRQFLNELGYRQEEPKLSWEDNKAAIIVAEGETSSAGRSKHIDVRFKHVAQSIREGVARVRYVSTKWNYADLMTKPLARMEFKRLRDLCLRPESGVTGHPSMEQGDDSMVDEEANFFFEESWLI
jgi:hypothetical protein